MRDAGPAKGAGRAGGWSKAPAPEQAEWRQGGGRGSAGPAKGAGQGPGGPAGADAPRGQADDRRQAPALDRLAAPPDRGPASPAHELPEDLLYGRNPVREALRKSRPISRLWLTRNEQDRTAAEIIGYCRQRNIPYKMVDKPFLDRLCCGMVHQGFACQAAPKAYVPWREMAALAGEKGEAPLIVLLDEVEDPHNLGAVLRSVDALGAHGAVIPKHRAAPLTGGVAKASAGAWEYVAVDRVTNLSQTIDEMKQAGFWIMGAAAAAGQTIYETDWSGPVALVLGGEDKGLTRLVEKKCDLLVRIPMAGQINSLNVSAAAAIILAEIRRQRENRGLPKV
jgi:23S rRNA (guanosine2251-2'-O)-methyltransferase